MSEHGDGDDPQPKRLIYEMREHVQRCRNRVWDDGIEGQMSASNKRLLAKAAIKYWDVLHEFRDSSAVSEGDFPDITPVRSRVGRQTQIPSASKRRGGGQQLQDAPAIDELDAWYLLELTEELDDLARKLGFGASERDSTPHDDISHGDLAALLEARGQEEALGKIPGGESG